MKEIIFQNLTHKVGTQKQWIGGTIKYLEKKYTNIEMLKESKKNESGHIVQRNENGT